VTYGKHAPAARCTLVVLFALGVYAQNSTDELRGAQAAARAVQARILSRGFCPAKSPLPTPSPGDYLNFFRDCIGSEVKQLRQIVRDYTLWKLNQSGGDPKQLAGDLQAIADIYARETIWRGRPTSDRGQASILRQETPSGELLVTIVVFSAGAMATPSGIMIVQGYRREGSRYVFAAETGDSVSGIMGNEARQALKAPVASEMWVLIGGRVGGFMGALYRYRIYGFDGRGFRELLEPEDREDMEITVTGDEIHTHFLPAGNRFGPPRHEMDETLKVTPNGVLRTSLVDAPVKP
jgi:hypothetical protein